MQKNVKKFKIKKFQRVTEANGLLLVITAGVPARRQQQCSASTWCSQPTAWAQQAAAHTAFPWNNYTPLLQRSKINWDETMQSRREKWIACGSREREKPEWRSQQSSELGSGRVFKQPQIVRWNCSNNTLWSWLSGRRVNCAPGSYAGVDLLGLAGLWMHLVRCSM